MSEETNSKFLEEIKKIQKANQKKATKWYGVFAVIFLLAVSAPIIIRFIESNQKETVHHTWQSALDLLDSGDPQEALTLALELIKTSDNYFYAHSCLADIYLANGNVKEAAEQYEKAYKLFPSEKMEADLKTIRKRTSTETNK